jgi:hypothetical protein
MQKQSDNTLHALKTFKANSRSPAVAEIAQALHPYRNLPGMDICHRIVLTPKQDQALIEIARELEYAVLMEWICALSWWDVVSQTTSLDMVQCVLAALEAEGIAHCDVAHTNLLFDLNSWRVWMIDVEEIYAPGLSRPTNVGFGTPGYKHKRNRGGLWGPHADRFAGAILLAEILGWHDPVVRKIAGREHYFEQAELQDSSSQRYSALKQTLHQMSPMLADYFEKAWRSKRLSSCPKLQDWHKAIRTVSAKCYSPELTGPDGQMIRWEPAVTPVTA